MRQLREENAALRGHADNVGLMRYQLQTLREQVERSRDMERKAVRLEEENKLLRERLASSGDEGSTTESRYNTDKELLNTILHICVNYSFFCVL